MQKTMAPKKGVKQSPRTPNKFRTRSDSVLTVDIKAPLSLILNG